jgi:hypothetical protein
MTDDGLEKKIDNQGLQNAGLAAYTVHEKYKTIRTIVICIAIILGLWITAWAVVRIALHVWWAEVISVLFGPTGLVTLWLTYIIWKAKRRIKQAEGRIRNEPPKS